MSARILKCSMLQYFNDPCERPSLSSSTAHLMVSKSPLHAWANHPRLGNQPKEATDATDNGTVIHAILLGKTKEVLHIVEADNFRTKVAQEERDAAIAAGLTPIIAKKFEEATGSATKIINRLHQAGIYLTGSSEVPIEWTEGNVLCRSMIDHALDGPQLFDVKSCNSAEPKAVARHFIDYGYDIQWAAYTRAWAQLHPEYAGQVDMVYLFCETKAPYAIFPCRPSGSIKAHGLSRWSRAVRQWESCSISNKWPGYEADGIARLEAPAWALADEMVEEELVDAES